MENKIIKGAYVTIPEDKNMGGYIEHLGEKRMYGWYFNHIGNRTFKEAVATLVPSRGFLLSDKRPLMSKARAIAALRKAWDNREF
jgi:hypothetical protein